MKNTKLKYITDVRWIARNVVSAYCNKHNVGYSNCDKCPRCERKALKNK